MNTEIKAKWVAALRSGEYKQGKNRLRNKDNNFCCLGVLCNLHAQAHPEIAAKQTDPCQYMDEAGMPHDSVFIWAGMGVNKVHRTVEIGGYAASLAQHNDSGRTFAEIADAIEAQL